MCSFSVDKKNPVKVIKSTLYIRKLKQPFNYEGESYETYFDKYDVSVGQIYSVTRQLQVDLMNYSKLLDHSAKFYPLNSASRRHPSFLLNESELVWNKPYLWLPRGFLSPKYLGQTTLAWNMNYLEEILCFYNILVFSSIYSSDLPETIPWVLLSLLFYFTMIILL